MFIKYFIDYWEITFKMVTIKQLLILKHKSHIL